jgi:hypothetical protein
MTFKMWIGMVALSGILVVSLFVMGEQPSRASVATASSLFDEWVQVNLHSMQTPDATFDSVERELSAPVQVVSLDGGQKYFRSDGCSTGCSTGCSVGCSSGCSSGCSNGCSYGCR